MTAAAAPPKLDDIYTDYVFTPVVTVRAGDRFF